MDFLRLNEKSSSGPGKTITAINDRAPCFVSERLAFRKSRLEEYFLKAFYICNTGQRGRGWDSRLCVLHVVKTRSGDI